MILTDWLGLWTHTTRRYRQVKLGGAGRRRQVRRRGIPVATEVVERRFLLSAVTDSGAAVWGEQETIEENTDPALTESMAFPVEASTDFADAWIDDVEAYSVDAAQYELNAAATAFAVETGIAYSSFNPDFDAAIDGSPIAGVVATFDEPVGSFAGDLIEATSTATTGVQDLQADAGQSAVTSFDDLLDSTSGSGLETDDTSIFDRDVDQIAYSSNLLGSAFSGANSVPASGSDDSSTAEPDSAASQTSGDDPPRTDDPPEPDPRLMWEPFVKPADVSHPQHDLPAMTFLDDLLGLTPRDTSTHRTTTTTITEPVVTRLAPEFGDGTRRVESASTVVIDQHYISPHNWTVFQSVTTTFVIKDVSVSADGSTTSVTRTGQAVTTITATQAGVTVSWSQSDTLTYNTDYSWDNVANTIGTPPPGPDDPPPPSIDNGSFSATYTVSAAVGVVYSESRITLPDGRSGRSLNLAGSMAKNASISVSGQYDFLQEDGTLTQMRIKGNPTNAGQSIKPSNSSVIYTLGSPAPASPTTPPPPGSLPLSLGSVQAVIGGNGMRLAANGQFNLAGGNGSNTWINVAATVPDGESVDDAVVTGDAGTISSLNFGAGGNQSLDYDSQESSGNPLNNDDQMDYLSLGFFSSGGGATSMSVSNTFTFGAAPSSGSSTSGGTTAAPLLSVTAISAGGTQTTSTGGGSTLVSCSDACRQSFCG